MQWVGLWYFSWREEHRQVVNCSEKISWCSKGRYRTQLSHLKDRRAEADVGVHRKDHDLKSWCSAWLTAGQCYSYSYSYSCRGCSRLVLVFGGGSSDLSGYNLPRSYFCYLSGNISGFPFAVLLHCLLVSTYIFIQNFTIRLFHCSNTRWCSDINQVKPVLPRQFEVSGE